MISVKFIVVVISSLVVISSAVEENICDGAVNGQFFYSDIGCSYYNQCINGVARLGSCSPPLNFHIVDGQARCDDASLVDCERNEPTTTTEDPVTTTTTVEPPPNICPELGVYFVPHPERCSLYVLCYDGYPTVKMCSAGYHFNPNKNTCMKRDTAECRIEDPICPAIDDPLNPTFFANPHYCQKYYICYEGGLIAMECDAGDHWSSHNDWCDDPELADCEAEAIE